MDEKMMIRKYGPQDIDGMAAIWNEVVEAGVAFPQEECLDAVSGRKFFEAQTYCKVAVEVARFASMWNMDGLVVLGYCEADYERLRERMHTPFVVCDGFFKANDRDRRL